MRNLLILIVFWAMLSPWKSYAQERYLDEVFSNVEVTSDTVYANNISIFPEIAGSASGPVPVDITMDVYEPAGDTNTTRPLVVISHTGTYFPIAVNGQATGSKTDSANVEIATRLAKLGYVVANIENRLGWFATSPDAEVLRETLLQATYRAIHDMRAAIRFFRKSAIVDDNAFGIDTSRIVAGGLGTGGYIAFGTAYLDDIEETQLVKFFNFDEGRPYVVDTIHGDPFGVEATQLNIPNNPEFSSEINMGFALGGALGDTSWVEEGEVPFVSLHNPEDRFAPYGVSDVIEPVNLDVVIADAAGGLGALTKINSLGINDIFKNDTTLLTDAFTQAAREKTTGLIAEDPEAFVPGLFPITPAFEPCETQCITSIPGAPADTCTPDGAPWHWYNEAVYAATWEAVNSGTDAITGQEAVCQSNLENPNDPVRSRIYVDTVIGFLAPRMFLVLGLDSPTVGGDSLPTSINNNLKEQVELQVFPNPANQMLRIQANRQIEEAQLFDLRGRSLFSQAWIRNNQFDISRNTLNAGMYILKISFKEGSVTEKVIFD